MREDGIVDLGRRLGDRCTSLRMLLASVGGLDLARRTLSEVHGPDARLDGVEYLPAIPDPGKIFCIGVNYTDHLEETKIRQSAHPTVFLRYPESQVGHGKALLRPRESTQFDYEGEVAIVIGKPGRRIGEQDVWDHIAGYACYNDGSVRDWQFHTTQWAPGKNFVATGGFGPWMTTADELDARAKPIVLTTRVNGEVLQHADTDLMIFPIPELIAYCSVIPPLAPGDVIVTGTPGGVGMAQTPALWLKPGDRVEVEVSGVGILRNTVAQD